MEAFLKCAFTAFLDENSNLTSTNVHLVIGSEAADLDSVISSITMAFMLHYRKDIAPSMVVPVVNCPRQDLPLRSEVVYWLRKHAISPDWLTHREDVTRWWTRVKGEQFHSFSVTLVDHNMPLGDMEFMSSYVVRIIDHHVLMPDFQEKIKEVADNGELYYELVGSCCTLVAHRYFDKEFTCFEMTTEEEVMLLSLLHGVILLDTICLNPMHDRFLTLDVEILDLIENRLGMAKGTRAKVYKELEDAKFDVTGLTNLELLRRDVKFLRPILAIASISGLDYVNFIHRHNLVHDIISYCQLEAVGLTIILTLGKIPNSGSDQLRRGIIVCRASDTECPLTLDLIAFFRHDTNLELESFPSPNPRLVVFAQNNSKLSRKYIMPAVAKFLESRCLHNYPNTTTTPLNSPQVNSDSENYTDGIYRDLPSMNNLATVQKVQAKRNQLSTEKENITTPGHNSEPFTPSNSLTKEGFMARLMHKGEDKGRLVGYHASQIDENEAKRVALCVVESALKSGMKRTVRSHLDEAVSDCSMQSDYNFLNHPGMAQRDSIKMKFTHTNSDVDGCEEFSLPEIGTRPRPYADGHMPRKHRNSWEVNIRDVTSVAIEKLHRPNLHLLKERTFESRSDSMTGTTSPEQNTEELTGRSDILPQDSLGLAASAKVVLPPTKTRSKVEKPDLTGVENAESSFSSSVFPEYLTDSTTISDCSHAETEFSFVLDGKRESYAIKIIKNYESVLQILADTYIYHEKPCKIVLFFACLLPQTCEPEYANVMNAMYLHLIRSMQELTVNDYILIYVNTNVSNNQTPNFQWLKECFLTLDTRVRKNIKRLFVVSPTFWTKAMIFFFSVFISKKFFDKIVYIDTITELIELLPQTRKAYFPHNCFSFAAQTNQMNDESLDFQGSFSSATLDTNDSID